MNIDSLSKLSMDGKIAVVTGSTQGLGETIAHMFAERGCSGMVIAGRNAEARVVFNELLLQMKRAPKYLREAQAEWLSIAEKQLLT